MKTITIPVPKELIHSSFFSNDSISWIEEDQVNLNLKKIFIYEAAYYSRKESLRPWKTPEESVRLILAEWAALKDQLRSLFEKREQQQASIKMEEGIGLFIEFLHWANEKPVQLAPAIPYKSLAIKPVNIEERLGFILARPKLYHSYMQLIELMKEMEKMFVKANAVKRTK